MSLIVIGSSAMDLVVTTQQRPQAGETLIGKNFFVVPGGKGANQAVACARLGAQVTFLGCVGDDSYGKMIVDNLVREGINTQAIDRLPQVTSGTAHITLADGDNSIIVIKGANDYITPAYIEKNSLALNKAKIVLIQQEIPKQTVSYVAQLCNKKKIPLLLNPAPARKLSSIIIDQVSYLTPNEHEAGVIFGVDNYHKILAKYPNKLIVTEGSQGVRYHDASKEQHIPGYNVDVIDTTGAGDTFNGAFAVAISEGNSIRESLVFANAAAALSVTQLGAQGGMPTKADVTAFLERR